MAEDSRVARLPASGARSALEHKRQALGQLDAVVAEGVADFPDLTLAESLQRLPAVAITRQNGEANQLTVRGLSALYTRTRVNGMDARAGVSGNSTRNFDFNLFAPELFHSAVVHKTASPELGEGSLGAVVDLATGSAFDFGEGWTLVGGAHGSYNDLSEAARPRLSGLVAYRDEVGKWGMVASAAYARVRNDTAIAGSGGWQKTPFGEVRGNDCLEFAGAVANNADCAEVADSFHPRSPGYEYRAVAGERLGLSGGLELRPSRSTQIRLDALYSPYDFQSDGSELSVPFAGNEEDLSVAGYSIQERPPRFGRGNDTLSALSVENGLVRSEARRQETDSRFRQVTLNLDHSFGGSVSAHLLAGVSRSSNRIPRDLSLVYTGRQPGELGYEFPSNQELPRLQVGAAAVTDPTAFELSSLRELASETEGGFDVLEMHAEWAPLAALRLTAGTRYMSASVETEESQQGFFGCVGLFDCDPVAEGAGPPEARGRVELSAQTDYPGRLGAGSPRQWATPSIDGWVSELALAPESAAASSGSGVDQKTLAFFLQAEGDVALGLGDMRLSYGAGIRYAQTRQTSRGSVSGEPVEVERPTYSNWLPSASAALWLSRSLATRFSAARVMARPELSLLVPQAAVDSFNYALTSSNPNYDPTFANAFDVAVEWYVAREALLSVAAFSKNIDSFPIVETRFGSFADSGLPRSAILPGSPADEAPDGFCGDLAGCWRLTQPGKGPGTRLKGFELAAQAPLSALFGALPPVIEGLGFAANYSLVESESDYEFLGSELSERLLRQPRSTYNATVYYEDESLGLRLSATRRGDALEAGPNVRQNLWQVADSSTRFDFWSRFRATRGLELNLELFNLTDEPSFSYVDETARRPLQFEHYGRTLVFGARFLSLAE